MHIPGWGLRILRTLPVSTVRLAVFFLAMSAVGFAIHTAGLVLALYPIDFDTILGIATVCFCFNLLWGAATSILLARFGGAMSFFASFILWAAFLPLLMKASHVGQWRMDLFLLSAIVLTLGLVTLVLSFVYLLRNSNAPYRRKPLLTGDDPFRSR